MCVNPSLPTALWPGRQCWHTECRRFGAVPVENTRVGSSSLGQPLLLFQLHSGVFLLQMSGQPPLLLQFHSGIFLLQTNAFRERSLAPISAAPCACALCHRGPMARPHPASKAGTNFLQLSGMLGSVLAGRGSAPSRLLPRWEAQREERMCGLQHFLGEPAGQLVSVHPCWPADPSSLQHIYLLFPQAVARCWDALSFNSLLPAGQLQQRGPCRWPCRTGAPWGPRACALRGHKPWCVGTPHLPWLLAPPPEADFPLRLFNFPHL